MNNAYRLLAAAVAALAFSLAPGIALAEHHENPCGEKAENPCNPCGGENPCNPCGDDNPCNPCGEGDE